jgi:pantetheine-phosphate adenylyltransferase
MERIAIYPGSFDPVTNGHLDIVERGLKLFDKVIVAILQNPKKQFLFPLEERLEMLKISMQDFPNVEADAFDGLLVDYAERRGAAACARCPISNSSSRWRS